MNKSTRRKKLEIIQKRAETPKPPTMKELTKNFEEFMEGKEYNDSGKEDFEIVKENVVKGGKIED